VTFEGRFHRADDAVLLPRPTRRVPIMLGSNGDRLLRIGLPRADAWNTWFQDFGNTAEGFAALNERISHAAGQTGGDRGEIARSACALIVLDRAAGERRVPEHVSAIEGDAAAIAGRVRELADAGADEVILVVTPITERSIRSLGDVVADLG
jgi:alkanesulfonate monooxygenase SsuD/methylene tetrahydromethanopterin reductase-like flavin-dependent oxidoreductase (luciferase family)